MTLLRMTRRTPMTSAVPHTQATLVPPAAGLDASQVADAAVQTWRAVDAALSPIIGPRGVAALYKRSLYLAGTQHPWLAAVHQDTWQPGDFEPLHAALARQPGPAAAAAQEALLQTYRDILGQLIGAPLTERLLRSIGPLPLNVQPEQDTPP
jgi:hypothetical protein